MEENEYLGFIEGYVATTDVDLHGDKLSPEAIEDMAIQFQNNPKLRIAPFNHDMTQPMGYITDVRVDTKGVWKGLYVKMGVFKSRPDLWEKILSGEIKGFSYSAKILEMEYEKMPNANCSFTIELSHREWHHLKDMLTSMGVETDVLVKKSLDTPTIIMLTVSILSLPGVIYGIYDLWKKLSGGEKGQWIKIRTTKRYYNFQDNTIEEIIKEIELESKKQDKK